MYKFVLKLIWGYVAQIWGCAKKSKINRDNPALPEQGVTLSLPNASWYVSNEAIHRHLNVDTVE